MDRQEWGEIVGDDGATVESDLRWALFQAERSTQTMRSEARYDNEVYRINQRRIRDCHVALAALWAGERPPIIL